jgi:N6-adenosine-specific RNA methylase IME4
MNIPFPNLEFKTVVADPPWQPTLGKTWKPSGKARPQQFYDTMSVKEICELCPPIAKQAHVYIWAIAQHVDWAYQVAEAWGASPIILWTWKKPGLGVGRFRCNTEYILVCRKGSRHGNPFGQGGRQAQATAGTLFEWPRGRHSEKPQELFDLVETLSPFPRLEMYARKQREGWHVWGDEVNPLPPHE